MNRTNADAENGFGFTDFLSEHFLTITFVVVACIILLVLIVKRKFVLIVLKTVPRDFDGAARALPFLFKIKWLQWRNTTVHGLFDSTADKYANKVCFYYEDQEWTYRNVQELSNRVGNYFQSRGYVKGDTIGLFMENRPEYVAIWIGLSKIGVVPALINYNLRRKPLTHSLDAVQCKGLIYGVEVANAVADLGLTIPLYEYNTASNLPAVFVSTAAPLHSDLNQVPTTKPTMLECIGFTDRLFYIYTSGTTGLPKAAIIKHGRFLFISVASNTVQRIGRNDVFYTALPLYHSAGGIMGIGQLMFGVPIALRKKFSASNFWTDCIKYNVTVSQYIGEICRYLLAQPPRPQDKQHKVRRMFGNGLRVEIWEEFTTRFNVRVSELYGSTEGNCNLINFDGKVGAAGFIPRIVARLSPVVIVKVDQFTGEVIRNKKTGLAIRCEPNEPGEFIGIISAKHPFRDFEGYSDSSSVAKKIIENVFCVGDKAFRSGDILVMDEYGYYYFKDRIGDTFRWKGENVSTTEVESVVNKWIINQQTDRSQLQVTNGDEDSIAHCVAYGVQIPGTEGRAGMIAIYDPDQKLDLLSLSAEMGSQLPAYARPLFIRILSEISTTATFKLKKVDLQKDGFNLCSDPIYFYRNNREYVLVDQDLYTNIVNGNIKV